MVVSLKRVLFILLSLIGSAAFGQEQPIGYWESHLPYTTGVDFGTDGRSLFVATKQTFFTLAPDHVTFNTFSKVNGMSSIGMQAMGYDEQENTTVLAYTDGNIDLYKDEYFYNIPDYKIKTIAGDKTIYSVYCNDGKGYLCTGQGVVVINLHEQAISEYYQFYLNGQLMPITKMIADDTFLYVKSSNGIYRADKNNPQLQNYTSWTHFDSTHAVTNMTLFDGKLFMADPLRVYSVHNGIFDTVYTSTDTMVSLNAGAYHLLICTYKPATGVSVARMYDKSFNLKKWCRFFDVALTATELKDSTFWCELTSTGLVDILDTNNYFAIFPNGPADALSYDIYAYGDDLYVAHGGYTEKFEANGNRNGFSKYNNGKWKYFKQDIRYPYMPFGDTLYDFVSIHRDEATGTVYAGSYDGGLFELHSDESFTIYKQNVFDLSKDFSGAGYYHVMSTALDSKKNLWVSSFSGDHELYVKDKTTGAWSSFINPYQPYTGQIAIDDADNVWYVCSRKGSSGGGIGGLNINGTPTNPNDDATTYLNTGVGTGNLPSAHVYCLAHDKNDNIWIGTSDGIGILYNASSCFSQKCDAEIPVVQYDRYAGYLFKGENVRTIAIDGANRKWIGTDNGVWLLSPDAGNSKIIYRFTAENSPLPSNHILKITVEPKSGTVYIGTDAGLVSYKSTSTEGGSTNSDVMVYPNPVQSDFRGTIAIKGLVSNADVRITDLAGHLVYKTTALGGQAVWNGLDYKGHKPQSGVYLIFATNADGSQGYAGKVVFQN